MYAGYPIYTPSQKYAFEHDEYELWKESFNINMKCKEFITDNIYFLRQNGNYKGFINELTETFGLERAMFVLARSLQNEDFDDRLGEVVKKRTEYFEYEDGKPENLNEHGHDRSRFYVISAFSPSMETVFLSLMETELNQIIIPAFIYEREREQETGVAI